MISREKRSSSFKEGLYKFDDLFATYSNLYSISERKLQRQMALRLKVVRHKAHQQGTAHGTGPTQHGGTPGIMVITRFILLAKKKTVPT